jgi:hypothetical protein
VSPSPATTPGEPRQLLEVARRPVVAADDDARVEQLAHAAAIASRAALIATDVVWMTAASA